MSLLPEFLHLETPLKPGVEFKTLFWVVSAYLEVLIHPPRYPRPLDDLAVRINREAEQSQGFAGLLYACMVGELLVEAHAQISPKEWSTWLHKHCALSEQTALTYMQMARGWSKVRISSQATEELQDSLGSFPEDAIHGYTPLTDPFASDPNPAKSSSKRGSSVPGTPAAPVTPTLPKITSPFDLLKSQPTVVKVSPPTVPTQPEPVEAQTLDAPIRETLIDRAPPGEPPTTAEFTPIPPQNQPTIPDEVAEPVTATPQIILEPLPLAQPDPDLEAISTQLETITEMLDFQEVEEIPIQPETPDPESIDPIPPSSVTETLPAPEILSAEPLTEADHSTKHQAYSVSAERIPTEELVTEPAPTPVASLLTFFISGNVVPKARPRVTSNGTFLPPQYRAWRNYAEVEIYRQLCDRSLPFKLPLRKAAIFMRFLGNHRTNSDLDNLAGSCLDALTLKGAGVLIDDRISCVPKLSVEYVPDSDQTGVWIEIEPLS